MKKIILISILVLLLISISSVSANDDLNQNITKIDDVDNQIEINEQDVLGASSPRTFMDLQSQIGKTSAGNTLTLYDDYEYTEGTDRTIGIAIYGTTKDIIIDGNGHTLNGKGVARILYVNEGATNIVVKNLNFINGYQDSGAGAIYWKGESGTIDNCNFTSNAGNLNGGAIIWSAAKGTITNCIFEKCDSKSQSGGAIYCNENSGQTTITNNKFISNTAKVSAAGIRSDGASIIISGNIFTDNNANDRGAALDISGSNSKVNNNQFIRNQVLGSGGAIFWAGESGTIDKCNFTSNTADLNGGAIIWTTAKGTITNCIFEKSTSKSQSGGAIYCNENSRQTTISNNVFSHNSAKTCGAGIGSAGANSVIANNNFTDNEAVESGAGVYTNGINTKIINNQFIRNKAQSGGAVYIEIDGITMDKCYFKDNYITGTEIGGGGGAIRWNGNSGTMTNCEFDNNKATTRGGAIYWNGDNAKMENNIFTKNTANTAAGGALVYQGNNGQIISNDFQENTATQGYGGALYVDGNSNRVNDNKFNKNIAAKGGGALYYEGTSGSVTSNTITENTAENAAGIRWSGDSATITGNKFKGNINKNGVNIIYGDGSKASVTKNTFFNNKESDNCIRWTSTDADISGNIYMDDRETKLSGSDLTMYYGGSSKLVFTLTTTTSQALSGKTISISFDNTEITATTNAQGQASMDIKNLTVGTYKATAKFAGDADYDASQATSTVTVKSTIEAKDLTAEIGNVNYNATFFDTNGKPLAKGEYVSFTVEGDVYRAQVGANGVATATFDKRIGEYSIRSTNTVTGETVKKNLKITKATPNLVVKAEDIAEGEDAVFDITANTQITDNVTLTVNNKNYPVSLEKGKGKTTVSNLTAGKYPYTVKYEGNENFTGQTVSGTLNVKSDEVIITAPDVTKYYGGPERLTVKLTDKTGAPLDGKVVSIYINGVEYNKTTDETGAADSPLNLKSGNYTIKIVFRGDAEYNAVNTTCNVEIKTTIIAEDLYKIEKANKPFTATLLDSNGKILPKGTEIIFNINGVYYTRNIEDNGEAKLNINLMANTYIITTYNTKTGESIGSTIVIKPRIVNNSDVTKYYRNGTQYHVTVLDDNGNPVKAGESVFFNINGVFYNRTTDKNGIATLNINLQPGNYVITTIYKNCLASNTIKVLPVLTAEDITMKYRDGTKFVAHLVDGQGKPIENATIIFNINGVFYNRTTDNQGDARLNIYLMPGEYIITSVYIENSASIGNKVTIKP